MPTLAATDKTSSASAATASRSSPMVSWWLAVALGVGMALAMSTQLLFQPFVWRNYPGGEILNGWLALFTDRVCVTLPASLALAAASRIQGHPARVALALCFSVALGVLFGQVVLDALHAGDAPVTAGARAGHVVQWLFIAGSLGVMVFLWRRNVDLNGRAQAGAWRLARMEHEVLQARLQALRSQIEPHFLFNTLAILRRLHRTEKGHGARVMADFLRYLRATLPNQDATSNTLGREMELVQAYLGVVGARMTGRLAVVYESEPGLAACEFPALTLATLVENAIKHGIAPAPTGGTLSVTARRCAEGLEVTVADTGVGFGGAGATSGSGIGLANIRSRLRILYGDRASLSLASNEPSGVRAIVRMPCIDASGAAA